MGDWYSRQSTNIAFYMFSTAVSWLFKQNSVMVFIGNAFVLIYLVHLVWLVENSHFNLLHLFQFLVTFSLLNFDSRNFDVFQAWLELSAPLHSWTDLLNWTWSHWLMSQNAEGMYFRFFTASPVDHVQASHTSTFWITRNADQHVASSYHRKLNYFLCRYFC